MESKWMKPGFYYVECWTGWRTTLWLSKCPSDLFCTGFSQSWSVCPLTEYLTSRRQSPFSSPHADVQPAQWWICNYWWLYISSELLQSAGMVIVKEVICIKLIIRRNKAHKSGHYQFSWKCFKHTLLCRVQGKKERISLFYQIKKVICQRGQRHVAHNGFTEVCALYLEQEMSFSSIVCCLIL